MPTTQLRALRRAHAILGAERLAQRLKVNAFRLEEWMLGHSPIPEIMFLRTVDIIMEHSEQLGKIAHQQYKAVKALERDDS